MCGWAAEQATPFISLLQLINPSFSLSSTQLQWDKVENKTGVIVYASAAVVALWLSSTVVGALNNVPLLPRLFELVGLGYSAWFTYRYLLFKSSREELLTDIEQLKKKVSGDM